MARPAKKLSHLKNVAARRPRARDRPVTDTYLIDAHGLTRPEVGVVPKNKQVIFISPLGEPMTVAYDNALESPHDVHRLKDGGVLTFRGEDGKPHNMYTSRYKAGELYPNMGLSVTDGEDVLAEAGIHKLPKRMPKSKAIIPLGDDTTLQELLDTAADGTYFVSACRTPDCFIIPPEMRRLELAAREPKTRQPAGPAVSSQTNSFTRAVTKPPSQLSVPCHDFSRKIDQAALPRIRGLLEKLQGGLPENQLIIPSIHQHRTPEDRAARGEMSAAERKTFRDRRKTVQAKRKHDQMEDLMGRFGKPVPATSSAVSASDRRATVLANVPQPTRLSVIPLPFDLPYIPSPQSSVGSAKQRKAATRKVPGRKRTLKRTVR